MTVDQQQQAAQALAKELIEAGLALQSQGRHDEALRKFEEAWMSCPESALAACLCGAEWSERGDAQRAEAAFSHAVTLSPQWPMPRYLLGQLHWGRQQLAQAVLAWQPLLQQQGTYFATMAEACLAMSAQEWPIALAKFDQAIAQIHDNAPLRAEATRMKARVLEAMQITTEDVTSPSVAPTSATAAQTQAHMSPAPNNSNAADDALTAQHVLLTGYQQHLH